MPWSNVVEAFKKEVIDSRVEVLKAMDNAIRSMNDEEVFDLWLSEGIPDAASEEDYKSIAEVHSDYIYVVNIFRACVKDYAKKDF